MFYRGGHIVIKTQDVCVVILSQFLLKKMHLHESAVLTGK